MAHRTPLEESLLEKVLALEKELLELKSRFPAPGRLRRFWGGFEGGVKLLTTHWVLFALLVGLYVNWHFGVGFFEDIQNRISIKNSSNYYHKIGEHLMEDAEFAAAGGAFGKALEINPSNLNAQHGLMKAQVLRPIGEGKEISPAAVETKLAYLRNIFGPGDHILLYWEGVLRLRQSGESGDLAHPKALFQESIKANPNFVGSRLELGNTYLFAGEIEKAEKEYAVLHGLNNRYAPALLNLGYCRLVMSTFEAETKKRAGLIDGRVVGPLKESAKIAPRPETQLHLGDAYQYSGQFDAAKVAHATALEMIKDAGSGDDAPAQLTLPFVFLPVYPGEAMDRGPALFVNNKEELTAFIYFSLSFDHALKREFEKARGYFAEALARDPQGNYSPFFAYKITSLVGLLKPDHVVERWLGERVAELCKGKKEGCKP